MSATELANHLSRMSTHPRLPEEHPADRQRLKDAARLLVSLDLGVAQKVDEIRLLLAERDALQAAQQRHPAANPATDVVVTRMPSPRDGASLIATERRRQIDVKGYTASSDARQATSGDLAMAGATYATCAERRSFTTDGEPPSTWPWRAEFFKPVPGDRVRELVKAGALIAAAIDRELASTVTL